MKLWFGIFGAALAVAFLASIAIKLKEPSLIVISLIGVVMMLVDLWHARNERDT